MKLKISQVILKKILKHHRSWKSV